MTTVAAIRATVATATHPRLLSTEYMTSRSLLQPYPQPVARTEYSQ